ncbi:MULTISPECIES: RNA-binding protein [Salinibaculum]|uniref:RNA-binding protein n=1 Tax=Salinibaculum TaxID=2732368 RepID=UPI0030D1788D
MSSVPFHYVDLRAFCYVTEDEERVEDALRTFLPEDFELQRAESEGHYGDRILVLSARVENADDVRTVLDSVGDLADDELDRIRAELDERVNENCSLFLTFDKQAAFKGDVRLGDGITVRGKVEAYPAKQEAAVENVGEAFEDL